MGFATDTAAPQTAELAEPASQENRPAAGVTETPNNGDVHNHRFTADSFRALSARLNGGNWAPQQDAPPPEHEDATPELPLSSQPDSTFAALSSESLEAAPAENFDQVAQAVSYDDLLPQFEVPLVETEQPASNAQAETVSPLSHGVEPALSIDSPASAELREFSSPTADEETATAVEKSHSSSIDSDVPVPPHPADPAAAGESPQQEIDADQLQREVYQGPTAFEADSDHWEQPDDQTGAVVKQVPAGSIVDDLDAKFETADDIQLISGSPVTPCELAETPDAAQTPTTVDGQHEAQDDTHGQIADGTVAQPNLSDGSHLGSDSCQETVEPAEVIEVSQDHSPIELPTDEPYDGSEAVAEAEVDEAPVSDDLFQSALDEFKQSSISVDQLLAEVTGRPESADQTEQDSSDDEATEQLAGVLEPDKPALQADDDPVAPQAFDEIGLSQDKVQEDLASIDDIEAAEPADSQLEVAIGEIPSVEAKNQDVAGETAQSDDVEEEQFLAEFVLSEGIEHPDDTPFAFVLASDADEDGADSPFEFDYADGSGGSDDVAESVFNAIVDEPNQSKEPESIEQLPFVFDAGAGQTANASDERVVDALSQLTDEVDGRPEVETDASLESFDTTDEPAIDDADEDIDRIAEGSDGQDEQTVGQIAVSGGATNCKPEASGETREGQIATEEPEQPTTESWTVSTASLATQVTEEGDEFSPDSVDPKAGETARMLLDIMSKPSGAAQPQERALAADTLLRLLPKIPVANLIALSERICLMEKPPALLVNKLLKHPKSEVAGPLLEGCSGISDQVLMSLIATSDNDRQRMIARRRSLTPTMCDALLEHGDQSVYLTIVRNPGASISHDAFVKLSLSAKDQTALQAPLVTRGDTPAPIAFELFWFLPSELRRYVLSRFLTDSETLDKILKITMAVDCAEMQVDEPVEASFADLSQMNELVDLIAQRAMDDAAALLADLAGINKANALRIISDDEGEPITVAMKAIGYPRNDYPAVIEKWRESSAIISDSQRSTTELQNLFDSLSYNKARMLLTYWDWASDKTGPYARKVA